jgi:hypothetical protein
MASCKGCRKSCRCPPALRQSTCHPASQARDGGGVGLVGGRVDDEHRWRVVRDAVNLAVARQHSANHLQPPLPKPVMVVVSAESLHVPFALVVVAGAVEGETVVVEVVERETVVVDCRRRKLCVGAVEGDTVVRRRRRGDR